MAYSRDVLPYRQLSDGRSVGRVGRENVNSEFNPGLYKMKRFDYDVVKFVDAIRDHPCLWDRSLESYKDRVERKAAWLEIFKILDERYDELSSDEQRLLSEVVINKWTSIRDTFVRSVKKKYSTRKKNYVLYEHLKFLLNVIPGAEQERDNLAYNTDHCYANEDSEINETSQFEADNKIENEVLIYEDVEELSEEETSPVFQPTPSKRRKVKKQNPIEKRNESPKVEDNTDVPIDDRIMNEDEAFFASLLPSVVKYSEEERLEFRIQVLAVMKRINDKRKTDFYNN